MEILRPGSAADWRSWLTGHAADGGELWLVIPHKAANVPGVTYEEAIEQALCFGWIDGLARKHDASSFRLRFTPRRPRSAWSASNVRRVARMTAAGLMTPAGAREVERARETGRWPELTL